ncbi:MAG: hypothetical protein M3O35_21055 [Acidobacteriota bacterium]|nr:hypothetical protein [Acidobacteriota bacterium]
MQKAALSIFISVMAAAGAVGGFLIGRWASQDEYVRKTSTLLATQNTVTTLGDVLGGQIDDRETAEALSKLYDVRVGDRDALAKRLRLVPWVPPYRRVPFVGHMAKPLLGEDLHINLLGFRDQRDTYVSKQAGTVRIFLTGGSTAWGSGAPSQKSTISSLLETILNAKVSPVTGYRYEVVNTAFPGWATTQEKILIQQRLVDMYPDVVLMLSGNNDIHWTREGRDIRWFFGPEDDNQTLLLNELYRSSGHPEWTLAAPAASGSIECPNLARVTGRNVEEAATAANRAQARLIFALQPNVATAAKPLTPHEQHLPEVRNQAYWNSCYGALRDSLNRIGTSNYSWIDLSRSFGEIDGQTELFVDSYHFAGLGNRLIAQSLADKIDWRSIAPAVTGAIGSTEGLKIVKFEPAEWIAGRRATATLRVTPGAIHKNLLVIFDNSVLPTVMASDVLIASVPASLYAVKGEHKISIADSMTGETSSSVVIHTR